MERKICSKCLINKELCEFNKHRLSKDGHKPCCRECQKIESKIYKLKNKEKIKEAGKQYFIKNRDRIMKVHDEYHINNIEKIKERQKRYYKNNKTKYILQQQIYRENNREKVNENKRRYQSQRRESDYLFRLTENMRSRVTEFMKIKNMTKRNKTFEIVGCAPKELCLYIEVQFTDRMSWDNYGKFGWHVDHIIPLDSAKTEEELYKLCHYTNLQPLWWNENLSKGSKILISLPNNSLHVV
jgi:hypothetical protein